jgi:hypothetical protein
LPGSALRRPLLRLHSHQPQESGGQGAGSIAPRASAGLGHGGMPK